MKRLIPRVSKKYLLLVAGLVWFAAGFNILRIGIQASQGEWHLSSILTSVAVFGLFFYFVFYRMVKKHTKRIMSYDEQKVNIFKFFDSKAYCIMTFMITFGILLRKSNLWPPHYIAIFYSGLGASLNAAGFNFMGEYITKSRGN